MNIPNTSDAGWHRLPNELRAEILSYLDVASVKALAQASPRDAANARLHLRFEDAGWEIRAASHPWLSQCAQSACDYILQAPRPSPMGDSGGLRGRRLFRYVYTHEQKAQQISLVQLRAYLAAESEDTFNIAPDVENACIDKLRLNYRRLSQSLTCARGVDTTSTPDAMRTYMMRAGSIAVCAIGLHFVGTVDLTQPQLWFACLVLMMLAACGLDTASPETV